MAVSLDVVYCKGVDDQQFGRIGSYRNDYGVKGPPALGLTCILLSTGEALHMV
jgi:hypothetical protein